MQCTQKDVGGWLDSIFGIFLPSLFDEFVSGPGANLLTSKVTVMTKYRLFKIYVVNLFDVVCSFVMLWGRLDCGDHV